MKFPPAHLNIWRGIRKPPWTAPVEFAKTLRTMTIYCGLVNEKKRVRANLAERLEEAICGNILFYRSQDPSEPVTQLARYIDTVTEIIY